jgi:hypothetical protein
MWKIQLLFIVNSLTVIGRIAAVIIVELLIRLAQNKWIKLFFVNFEYCVYNYGWRQLNNKDIETNDTDKKQNHLRP